MNTNYDKDYYNTIEQIAKLQYWVHEEEYKLTHYITNNEYDYITEFSNSIKKHYSKLIELGYDENRIDFDVVNFDLSNCEGLL